MTSFFRIISGLFLMALMSACGGGGGSPGASGSKVALFTSAAAAVNILPGQTQTYSIGGGVPNYTATTSNAGLTVSVSGTTLTIAATSQATGTFTVTVTDYAGTHVSITVTVGTGASLKTNAGTAVSVLIGAQSASYGITGGSGLYTVVSSNNAVANVIFNASAGTFIISGVSAGTATVVVSDSLGNQAPITVTVGTGATLSTSAPTTIGLNVGALSSVFQINGGSGSYNVASGSSNVRVNFIQGGSAFSLVGVNAGTANVTVSDTLGGSVNIFVTVGTGSTLFTSSPFSINVSPGATSSAYQIGGGSGIYFVSSSNSSVATANLTNVQGASQFTVTGIATGTAVISVSDSLGASIQVTVTIGTASGTLTTSASSSISVAVGGSSAYRVQGGTAPYSVGSSNNSVVSATLVGGNLTVTGNAVGQATLTILDSSTQSVSIAVQVGSAAKLFTTAPSAITLGTGTISSTFTIGGGSQMYSASSANTSVAYASLSGNTFIITGVASGSTSINITDTNGTSVTIGVTVTGSNSSALFTTAPTAVTLSVSGSASYSINGGTGPYTAVSSNSAVLSSVVTGTTFQLTGNASGTATVTIKDSTGAALPVITVTVSGGSSNAMYTTAPSAVQISIGSANAPQYQIYGGVPNYTVVSSSTSVATVALSGNTFTVTGVAPGTANIVITDSTGVKPITIAVTVGGSVTIPFYTSTPGAVTLTLGATAPTFVLGGGTAPYVASSSNTSVVTTSVSGNTLTLTAISPGSATVTMVDSGGSSALSATITVVSSSIPTLSVAPTSVTTAYVGDVLYFNVNGGTPPYTVTSNNPASITIGNVSNNATNSTFTATMANVNTSVSILVADSKGNTQTISIGTIAAEVSAMSLTPVAWTILDNNTSSITLTLNGGIAPFQVFSSSPTASNVALLSSVVVTNNGVALTASQPPFFTDRTLTINLGSQGTRCVLSNTPITFTVKDSLGTSAASVMTIQPAGTCP